MGFYEVATEDQACVFAVHKEGYVYAYINRCPHTGAPLDWQPHMFLSPDGMHIQCSMHGARFRIEDGLCIAGPCAGRSLKKVMVTIEGGDVYCVLPQTTGQSQ